MANVHRTCRYLDGTSSLDQRMVNCIHDVLKLTFRAQNLATALSWSMSEMAVSLL